MNEETMTVEEVKALLETTRKGFPSNSIDNCLTVFRSDPMLKGSIKRNCLTGRTDRQPLPSIMYPEQVDRDYVQELINGNLASSESDAESDN